MANADQDALKRGTIPTRIYESTSEAGTNFRAAELMHYRSPLGGGPSGKT